MNKSYEKSILRQFVKKCKRQGLGKFLQPKCKIFELHKLREEQIDRIVATKNPKTVILANIMFEALRQS